MRRRAAFLLASLAFTWLFFAEYLSPFHKVHIPYDLEGYHYPLVDYGFHSLRQGRFPLWDWGMYSGISYVGNIQAAFFYPPTWLLFLVNLHRQHISYLSLETWVIAHVWLGAALCMFWLRARGLTPFACVAGAQVFAFSGYMCLQLQHQGLVTAFAWYPLAAWGIDEAAASGTARPLWKVVVASALVFLSGYPPMWAVFAVVMLAYTAGHLRARAVAGTAMALVASLLLAMVQVLPAWQARQWMTPDARYGQGIKDPLFYVSYLIPNYFDFGLHVPVGTNFGREYLYLGAPAFAGLLLLLLYRRDRAVLPGLGALLASAVFLVNPWGLVWSAIQWSPLWSAVFRDWYFLAGIAFAVAALAALGLDAFLARPGPATGTVVAATLTAAMAGWMVWEFQTWKHEGFRAELGTLWIVAVTLALFLIGLHFLRGARGGTRCALFAALILIAGLEYKVFGTSKRFNSSTFPAFGIHEDGFTGLDSKAYREMVAHPQYRVAVDATGPGASFVRAWGATTPQGFDPLLPEQYRDMVGAAAFRTNREFDVDPLDEVGMHLLGARYFITADSSAAYKKLISSPKYRLIGSPNVYYKTFEYLGYEPFEPDAWEPEHRVLRTSFKSPEEVTLREQFLPGWSATIDGEAAAIERWRGAYQAVRVPAGEHKVEFRYRSPGLWAAAMVSLLSVAGLAWFARPR
jgi:hypothetical protein